MKIQNWLLNPVSKIQVSTKADNSRILGILLKSSEWKSRWTNSYFISAAVFVPPDPINHFAAIDRNSVLQVFSLQTKEEARFYSIRQCFAHFFSKKMPRAKNWRIKKNWMPNLKLKSLMDSRKISSSSSLNDCLDLTRPSIAAATEN